MNFHAVEESYDGSLKMQDFADLAKIRSSTLVSIFNARNEFLNFSRFVKTGRSNGEFMINASVIELPFHSTSANGANQNFDNSNPINFHNSKPCRTYMIVN